MNSIEVKFTVEALSIEYTLTLHGASIHTFFKQYHCCSIHFNLNHQKGRKNTVARKRPTPYSTDRNKPYTLENVTRTAEPQNTQQEFNGKLL